MQVAGPYKRANALPRGCHVKTNSDRCYRDIDPSNVTLARPSKRSVIDGTLSCITLGIVAGNVIGLALFSMVFILYMVAV